MERLKYNPEQKPVLIPATPSENGIYEVDFRGRIRLNRVQVMDLFGLYRDNPFLDEQQKGILEQCSIDCWKNSENGGQIEMRNGFVGVYDLLRYNQTKNGGANGKECLAEKSIRILRKIRETTQVEIIDVNSFNASTLPLELQYALGLGGEKLIKDVQNPKIGGSSCFYARP